MSLPTSPAPAENELLGRPPERLYRAGMPRRFSVPSPTSRRKDTWTLSRLSNSPSICEVLIASSVITSRTTLVRSSSPRCFTTPIMTPDCCRNRASSAARGSLFQRKSGQSGCCQFQVMRH